MEDILGDDLVELTAPQDPSDMGGDELLFDDGLDELLGGGSLTAPTPQSGQLFQSGGPARETDALRGWKGYLELRPRVFLRDRDQGQSDEELFFEAEFEFDFQFTDELSGFFRPRVLVETVSGDIKRFEPYEGYLTWSGEGWDVRGGQFVENWGVVDTYNPLDVLNRRDLAVTFLRPDRLGELGLRMRRYWNGGGTLGEPALALYLMPAFRRTPFPPPSSRFSVGIPGVGFDEDAAFLPEGQDGNLYALRSTATLDTAPFNSDVQLLASYGPVRFPVVAPKGDGSGDLRAVYYGASTFGGGLRAVANEDVLGSFLSTFTLKTELTYTVPYSFEDSPIATPDNYFAYVAGVDRSFYGWLGEQDDLTLTIEYAGETGASDLASIVRPFRSDLILRGFWQANDFARTSFELRGIFDTKQHENIFEAVYETQLRSISDDLKLRLNAQLYDVVSSGVTFLSFFPNNTNVSLGLRWDL